MKLTRQTGTKRETGSKKAQKKEDYTRQFSNPVISILHHKSMSFILAVRFTMKVCICDVYFAPRDYANVHKNVILFNVSQALAFHLCSQNVPRIISLEREREKERERERERKGERGSKRVMSFILFQRYSMFMR